MTVPKEVLPQPEHTFEVGALQRADGDGHASA
jgi:hypothetical protein